MSLPQESLVTSSQDTFGLPEENKPISDVSELVKFLKTNASAQRKKGGKVPVGLIDEEKVVSEGKQQFPWMTRFSHLCREAVGSQSIKTLENLISVYIRNVTEDVKQCYKKPKRAGKLKCKMNDALKLFHMLYSGIKKPLEHTFYLDKMSDLMAMYIDMELKASRRGRENLKKISRRLTSSLFIFLDNSTDHILDAILRSKFFTKTYSEICIPVLIRILRDSPGRQVYEMTYVRYLLAFKLWKRFVDKKEERIHINKMAASKLTPPTGFLDKLRSGMFNGILPYVSKSEKERITLFLMRAPFNVKEKAEAFQKISRDPKEGLLVVHPGADLDKSLFFSEELKFSSESDNKMDCGSIMLINDIWSSMANTEAGPTDCLKLNNLCSDKTSLETKKKKNKNKIKHLPKEKSNKTNIKDKTISSYDKEKKRKKCKDKSLKLNLLEDSLSTKEKISEKSFLDKLKRCKSDSISLLLTDKQVDEKEKKVQYDLTETCATVKSEDVCDEIVVDDNKNKKEIADGLCQTDVSVESTCEDDGCISSTDNKDKVNVGTEGVLFKENTKVVNIKVTAVTRNVNEMPTEDKLSGENSSELTESSVIKTESVENDTNIIEIINDDDKSEVENSTNINERVVEEASDPTKVVQEIEIGSEPQEINQEVCVEEENPDNESLDCSLDKDPSSASSNTPSIPCQESFTSSKEGQNALSIPCQESFISSKEGQNTLTIPCQETFMSSKEGQNEIHTSFPRDIFFGDNFYTNPPTFPEGNEDLVSQLLSEWPPQAVGFDLPKDHDNYLPAVLLRNDIVFGGLFPEATIDNDEVSDEDINNCYHGQSQYSKGAKVAFGEMATGSNLEDTETEWAEQDLESSSPVNRSDVSRNILQPAPIPVVSETTPAPVPVPQKQHDGEMSQSAVHLGVGCKKNEMSSKIVSEETHSAYNSMSQNRQIPPTSVSQTSVTASTPVSKSNKEKSITKGKRASTRQTGMSRRKAKERTVTEIEEEDDEDKINLDDVPLFSREDMLSDTEEQDLEEEIVPKKRRGRKPKKVQPPTTSPVTKSRACSSRTPATKSRKRRR